MEKNILDPTVMLNVVGVIISLLTSYLPGFREWYAALKPVEKGLGQVIAITIVVVAVGIVSWTGFVKVVSPGNDGLTTLVLGWIYAVIANQVTYQLSPQIEQVKEIKSDQQIK